MLVLHSHLDTAGWPAQVEQKQVPAAPDLKTMSEEKGSKKMKTKASLKFCCSLIKAGGREGLLQMAVVILKCSSFDL